MSKVCIAQLRDPTYRTHQAHTNYAESAPLILAFFAGHNAAKAGHNYKDTSAPFVDDAERLEAFNLGWDEGSKANV